VLNGDIWLGSKGSVILVGAATADGAVLSGTGRLISDGVTIVGGANGWQAVTAASSVAIGPNNTITSTGNAVLTAVAAGTASITVAAGKKLTIDNGTVISLLGSTSTTVGSITLLRAGGGSAVGGTLAFGKGTTASITTSNSTPSPDTTPLITHAAVGLGLTSTKTGGNKLISIIATDVDAATLTIQANTGTDDVVLDSDTDIA
jgi:hypothetical protein